MTEVDALGIVRRSLPLWGPKRVANRVTYFWSFFGHFCWQPKRDTLCSAAEGRESGEAQNCCLDLRAKAAKGLARFLVWGGLWFLYMDSKGE